MQYFAAFGFGLFLDLPVLGWFFLPSWIWLLAFPNRSANSPKTTKLIFVISALAVILLTAIDCGYSRVTARRRGTELLSLLGDEGNHIGPYLAEYWWGWVLFLIGVALVYVLTPSKGHSLYIYSKQYPKWKSILFIAITGFVWLTIARGGWRIKPLSSVDAAEFVSPSFSPIASSTPLQFLSTIGQKPVLKYSFMSDAEAEKIVLGNYRIQTQNQKKNVVFLIVESLSRDYTGFLNGKNYTPFLDSLSKLSTNFRFCFANGVRSIEMVPSIFCGIPGIGESQFINSAYAANKIENAYRAFEKQGYATAFFHGAQNGTMRFQAFFAQTGLSNYYGLNEFPSERRTKDVIFTWGVHDEPYLEYVADMTEKLPQPFFISVFTLSSHHPYKIPEKYEKSLPAGTLPIHKTVAYADVSLKNYFAAIQNTAWYKNTIFVITGDHTSYSKDAYFYSQTGH
ncbi:MAG: sulfatase-like hydrolase/transferase [Bacteroidia bacterium]|nr:sulfatase-like hydrolase/transferase [Bacteroidia bacterium]